MLLAPEQILYVDNHLLALDKPSCLPTQPAEGVADSLEDSGKFWLKETYHKPGNVFLEAVHRIDKAVCGVVLFARTSKALSRLNAQMREGRMVKIYHALVEGELTGRDILLEDYLVHDDFHAHVVSAGHPEAKRCRLRYTSLGRKGLFTLLEIQLETGRYHQIRAQLAHCGHPLAGDVKYGASRHWTERGAIALQSFSLKLLHPVTMAPLLVQSNLSLT